jgi:hypothetical protein
MCDLYNTRWIQLLPLFYATEAYFVALNYRLWPSGIPRLRAFWRNEPTLRFVSLAILATGVLALECARSSLTSAFEYSRRTTLLALAMITPLVFGTWLCNTKSDVNGKSSLS